MLDEVIRRPEWDASWVHTRGAVSSACSATTSTTSPSERVLGAAGSAAGRPLGLTAGERTNPISERPLELTRAQILAHRRRVGALDERLPAGARSLRRAAWAGLRTACPGPRCSRSTPAWRTRSRRLGGSVARPGLGPAVQRLRRPAPTTGRCSRSAGCRTSRQGCARRVDRRPTRGIPRRPDDVLRRGGPRRSASTRTCSATGRRRAHPDPLGGRPPAAIWTVPRPESTAEARRELARRYLHVLGPGTADAFADGPASGRRGPSRIFDDAGAGAGRRSRPRSATAGSSPPTSPRSPGRDGARRLRPSASCRAATPGSCCGARTAGCSCRTPRRRGELWTPRVWPGAILVGGEIAGVWRRASAAVSLSTWRTLSPTERDAVVAEAESLPLPDVAGTDPGQLGGRRRLMSRLRPATPPWSDGRPGSPGRSWSRSYRMPGPPRRSASTPPPARRRRGSRAGP